MAKGTMAECSKCGARVKKENLKRHVAKVHGKDARASKAPKGRAATREAPVVAFPWRLFAALTLAVVVVLAAYWIVTRPTGSHPPVKNPVVTLEVRYDSNVAPISIELDMVRAPRTAENFLNLAKFGFYDHLIFHRIVADFVVQGGDPNGDGSGGSGTPVQWENTGLRNQKYTVAMARSGNPNLAEDKDAASSQFFFNLKDNADLDAYAYPFVVFGKVTSGQTVVDDIGRLPTDQNDRPLNPPEIMAVTVTE